MKYNHRIFTTTYAVVKAGDLWLVLSTSYGETVVRGEYASKKEARKAIPKRAK